MQSCAWFKRLSLGRILAPLAVIAVGLLLARIITLPNALSIDVYAPQHTDMYQLFYDIGNGYNGTDSEMARILPGEAISTVSFSMLPFRMLQHLRIDPGTREGAIRIESITLLHNSRLFGIQIPLMEWSGPSLAEEFAPLHHIDGFGMSGDRLSMISLGDDPHFHFQGSMDSVRATIATRGASIRRYLYGASLLAALFVFFSYRKLIDVGRKVGQLCMPYVAKWESKADHPLALCSMAGMFVAVLFFWQGNKGFSLWDEGFLWYGAQRVMLGEVPVRDFMAYDPGRYYWSAAIMHMLGDSGIMSLRFSVAVFQALGLSVALLLIRETLQKKGFSNFMYMVLSSVTLLAWMYPRHKLFDLSLSIFLIGILTFLINNPSLLRYFSSGMGLGLVAVFGRNHGVYGMVGSLAVIVWLHIHSFSFIGFMKRLLSFGTGVMIGYLPVLLMLLFIPGYTTVFLSSIIGIIERQTTNLPLPIPWPWIYHGVDMPYSDKVRNMLIGCFFIATLAFGVLSIGWVVVQRCRRVPVSPVFVACAFMSLPYAHYAFSRADVGHLAHGIFPLLIGLLVCYGKLKPPLKWSFAVGLCCVCFWVMHVYQPGWQSRVHGNIVDVEISGSQLRVPVSVSGEVALLKKLVQEYAPNGQPIYVAPFWPGAYAVLQQRSPTWVTYALWSRSKEFQEQEIERLKNVPPVVALIIDIPLDGREALRFRNTNPYIMLYLEDCFDPVPHTYGQQYLIYQSRIKD